MTKRESATGMRELLGMGAAEIMVTPVLAGDDKPAALDRTLKLVGPNSQVPGITTRR